jgi:hypothetical protein
MSAHYLLTFFRCSDLPFPLRSLVGECFRFTQSTPQQRVKPVQVRSPPSRASVYQPLRTRTIPSNLTKLLKLNSFTARLFRSAAWWGLARRCTSDTTSCVSQHLLDICGRLVSRNNQVNAEASSILGISGGARRMERARSLISGVMVPMYYRQD